MRFILFTELWQKSDVNKHSVWSTILFFYLQSIYSHAEFISASKKKLKKILNQVQDDSLCSISFASKFAKVLLFK